MDEDYLIAIQEKEPIMPKYEKEIHIARIYSIPVTIIVIFCAMISLITNIKRKDKIRIILSIAFTVFAIIIKYILDNSVRNFMSNHYKGSIEIVNFFGMSILIIMFITLIVMIFKRKK